MTIAIRSAITTWKGSLASGSGELTSGSGALHSTEVTWASRTERSDGLTSPEELCAAAHSSCFAMAFALTLAEAGVQPGRTDVSARVFLEEVDGLPTIVFSELHVRAAIPDLDERAFEALIAEASALCPVSRLFAGAEVRVEAELLDALCA